MHHVCVSLEVPPTDDTAAITRRGTCNGATTTDGIALMAGHARFAPKHQHMYPASSPSDFDHRFTTHSPSRTSTWLQMLNLTGRTGRTRSLSLSRIARGSFASLQNGILQVPTRSWLARSLPLSTSSLGRTTSGWWRTSSLYVLSAFVELTSDTRRRSGDRLQRRKLHPRTSMLAGCGHRPVAYGGQALEQSSPGHQPVGRDLSHERLRLSCPRNCSGSRLCAPQGRSRGCQGSRSQADEDRGG